MSESQISRSNNFSQYDAMTTEELEEILRLDAETPVGQESDTETLLYVMGVLAGRNRNNGHTEKTALEAYESFKQHYMPVIEKSKKPVGTSTKKQGRALVWLRRLSAAAAVLVLIFIGSITAKALGLDIWEAVVTWTQETFHLSGWFQTDEPNPDGDLKYASLNEVLVSVGINESLLPTWFPDGYELTDIRVEATPKQNTYIAIYKGQNNNLKISVLNHLDSAPEYIEQSDDSAEVYESKGTTFYIFSNNDKVRAVWIIGSFECHILGDLSIEELKLMIDSI